MKKLRDLMSEFLTKEEQEKLKELTGSGAAGAFSTPFAFQGGSSANRKKRKDSAETAGYKAVPDHDDEETKSMKEVLKEGLEGQVDKVLRNSGITPGQDYEWKQGKILVYQRSDADDILDALIDQEYSNATLTFPYITFGVHSSMKEDDRFENDPEVKRQREKAEKQTDIEKANKRALLGLPPTNEGGDPYYAYRNDSTQTPRQKLGRAIAEVNLRLAEIENVIRRNARLKKESDLPSGGYWKRTNRALYKIEARTTRIAQAIRQLRD